MGHRLWISVFRHLATDDFGRTVGAPSAPPLRDEYLEITHLSTASEEFPPYSAIVQICPEVDCAIAFGTNPVADPDKHFVSAFERLSYGVSAGMRIAVIEVLRT